MLGPYNISAWFHRQGLD